MAYHSINGRDFVGLRLDVCGNRQVVYDALLGKRVLLNIKDSTAPLSVIDDALREGVAARNVLSGVLKALNSRNIDFDY